MLLIIYGLFFLVSLPAHAISPSAGCYLHNRPSNTLVRLTAIIAGSEREDLGKYAQRRKEDVKDYSGTGMISCYDAGGLSGTAQLVRKKGTNIKNVIVTAAHNLFNDSCELLNINNCYFVPLFQPTRRIRVTVENQNIGGCLLADNSSQNDWAILKLKEDVSIARPYLVPDQPVKLKDHVKLTQVTAFADNFSGTKGHAVDCESRDSFYKPEAPLLTTCSSGHGTSGSALVQKKKSAGKNENWLYGIAVSVPGGAIDGNEYSASGPYSNYTAGAPLEGRFFERLDAVLKEEQNAGN